MFDIITFGSATEDILVRAKNLTILKYKKEFAADQSFVLPVGSKIDVDEIKFTSGGGGTNTAATFSLQGFKTAFCGAVGKDKTGKEIIEELKELKVNTDFVLQTDKKPTNRSIIILKDAQDRTILTYRGASELCGKKDISFKKIKTCLPAGKWLYLAPISGLLCDIFGDVVDFAYKNKIKVALNPGIAQLSLPMAKLKNVLRKSDILILNQEEASFLTKIPFENEKEVFQKIDEICPCVAIMTKGKEGVVVSDGQYLYSAKPHLERKIADTTGAGDAFGSGFVAEFIKSKRNVERSIQFAMANAASCLYEIGAKNGLLKKGEKFYKVKVTKVKI